MLTCRSTRELQRFCAQGRLDRQTISLVPTMGYLHEGHLSLIREGRKKADLLVVSIYVNPLQFSPNEDLESYPSSPERDAVLCEEAGADVLFLPGHEDLYPTDYQTTVSIGTVADGLCGASRPGHFNGVCTVVLKLFNLVQPNVAIFGNKDYQQLQVIRTMTRDLNLDIAVIGMPIIRDPDGVALSSRNKNLSDRERTEALCLPESLALAEKLVLRGERDSASILNQVRAHIASRELAEIDYVTIVDPNTLEILSGNIHSDALVALAVRFGTTRLIDNRVLRLSHESTAGDNQGL